MSHSVCLMQRRDRFVLVVDGEIHVTCLASNCPIIHEFKQAQQFMKLSSFICLTYHLSDNLKIRHKFSPTTYTNQKFWFHLCYIHYTCPYDPLNKIMCFVLVNYSQAFQRGLCCILFVMHRKLIDRRSCFYIYGIQKCTKVFKLKIFNLQIQNFR